MSEKIHYVLYGAVVAATTAASIAFVQHWDTLFFLVLVVLFYGGVWAVNRIASLEKESYASFMAAESLRERIREHQDSPA
jgi:hypothetical protein